MIELKDGCVWLKVLRENRPVGILFIGPSKVAVDAFAETSDGVVGHAVDVTLDGFQLLMGDFGELENTSSEAIIDDIRQVGFENIERLLDLGLSFLAENFIKVSKQEQYNNGSLLIGVDSSGRKLILANDSDKLVLVYAGHTTVISEDRLVNLGHDGIHIVGPSRHHSLRHHGLFNGSRSHHGCSSQHHHGPRSSPAPRFDCCHPPRYLSDGDLCRHTTYWNHDWFL